MTIPAGWTQESTNLYTTNTFNVGTVNYQMKVNSQTGAMDLYVQSSTGNTLFARSNSGNNLTLVSSGQNAFVNSLPPNQRTNLTSASSVANYLSTNFSLQANTARANVINGLGVSSNFTNMPGVNGVTQSAAPVATPTTVASTSGTGNAISDAVSTGIDILRDPFSGARGINFNSTDEKSLFANFLLKYPQDLLENQQDTLVIEQFKYSPPNSNFLTQSLENIVTGGLTRSEYSKEILGTVILPIPQGVTDSNNVDWGGDNLSQLSAAATSAVAQNLPTYAGMTALGALFGQVAGTGAGQGAQAAAGTQLNFDLAKAFSGSAPLKTLFGAGLVSTILGQAGYEVPPESMLARGFGIAPNSNLELLFSGPTLRQFTFTYRMSPRGETEAKAVRNIIRFFKQGMSPRKQQTTSGSTASFFLGTPNIFRMKYTYNGTNQIKGLNRFKDCALTGFSVNYSPDGQWSSYGGTDPGQPVSVIISLSFNELDPVYNTDYNATSDDEVGF